jgi:hypothetical protein
MLKLLDLSDDSLDRSLLPLIVTNSIVELKFQFNKLRASFLDLISVEQFLESSMTKAKSSNSIGTPLSGQPLSPL